jgi:hypothetical protein
VSDIARVYVNGSEPAKGGQTGGTVAVNGSEKASVANGNLAVDAHKDLAK